MSSLRNVKGTTCKQCASTELEDMRHFIFHAFLWTNHLYQLMARGTGTEVLGKPTSYQICDNLGQAELGVLIFFWSFLVGGKKRLLLHRTHRAMTLFLYEILIPLKKEKMKARFYSRFKARVVYDV